MSWVLASLMFLLPAALAGAAELKLTFPQNNRKTFQTNERIDVSVVRSGEADMPAGTLTLALVGEKSKMTFAFDLKGVTAADGKASATDHLHLNGWMLKPGKYTLEAAIGALSDAVEIEVFSHIRKSSYRLIHWGGPRGDGMAGHGEDGLGFNLMIGGVEEISIREKMDIMGQCLMGGMHQHDGNLDCDWSDPNVYIGAIQRGMDNGMNFRTMPNLFGFHLHDEPGLTHYFHPHFKNAQGNPARGPHDIPAQRNAYKRAFDEEQPWANEVDTKTEKGLADWTKVGDFKLGYMDAFWKASHDAVARVKPGAVGVTQCQYGWPALYDGYYFNVVRSNPIVSGHGGYAHFWLWNLNPSFFLEMSLPRAMDKPTWYLPGWGNYTNEQCRQEQYMSFITGVQGIAQPPMVRVNTSSAEAIKETNNVIARLGTIFVKPAYTRQDVTMLYSKSNIYYNHVGRTRQNGAMGEVYLATRLLQYPMNAIVEEDVLDGTLADSHKAVIITGVEYLDPAVIDALADFAKGGGVVIVSDDAKVTIPGATKLGMEIKSYEESILGPALAGKTGPEQQAVRAELDDFTQRINYAKPLAKKLGEVLVSKKILPPFTSSVDSIAAGYQVRGEIEYTFAVNFTIESQPKPGGNGQPGPTTATITLPDNGRPVYDAMAGKEIKFAKDAKGVSAKFDFAAGDMKAFARPARPIGGVLVSTPIVDFDLTREGQPPIQMTLAATLVDTKNQVISGTAPLQIVVKDSAGNVRFDIFRATDAGVCSLVLPLAANDAPGKWTVTVTDLLAGTKGEASFEFKPLTRARNLAGATHRAVFFDADKANIYRFFRDQRNVIIAIGSSDYNQAAAERLAAAIKPYNINSTIVKANEVLARELTEEEAFTWCGTVAAGGARGIKAGRANSPQSVGWDLPNPVIVLGTPDDNVMIKHMTGFQNRCVLAYRPSATFPGKGNGMVAWNIHNLGHDVHALVCIGYDAEGMAQAVGTLFELGVGLDPLFPLAIPKSAVIEVSK